MNYIEELLAESLISAPGCPETVVERVLRTSCMAFYRETSAWRMTTDPLPVIKGVREVDLDVPVGTQVCHIFWAKLAGKDLSAISPRNLIEYETEPRGYAFNGLLGGIQMDTIPERTYTRDGLVVALALTPTVALDELPDAIYFSHRDGILYAAQARLMAMPNVPWGDLNGAMAMMSLAEAEKVKARREAESIQAPVTRVVRYGGI
jgi:hypothetical protein